MDQPTRPLRVLVVDDYDDGGDSYAALLTLLGHFPAVARSCRQAEALAPGFGPDAVLLDIDLPDGDGYGLAERLRAALPRPPAFVAVTGRPGLEGRSREAGFDGHFAKPMDPRVLAEKLRRIAAGGCSGVSSP
jgi:CheY-like chemotaxis protein